MTATLDRAALADKAGAILSRRWGSGGHRCPVAERIALRLGLRPMAVEKLLYGENNLFRRTAIAIDGFNELHQVARLVRAMEPIDAALARIQVPDFSLALVQKTVQADSDDIVARELLLTAQTRAAALIAIRRSQAARAALLEYELAAAKKWQICL